MNRQLEVLKSARRMAADNSNNVKFNSWGHCAVGYIGRAAGIEAPMEIDEEWDIKEMSEKFRSPTDPFVTTVMRDVCLALGIHEKPREWPAREHFDAGDFTGAISSYTKYYIQNMSDRAGILMVYDRAIKAMEAKEQEAMKKMAATAIVEEYIPTVEADGATTNEAYEEQAARVELRKQLIETE
jgi:hypothetical protein